MKTKRAFLRNSIRGARTLVFSPPDSSGLPGWEQLQAFLCFLGCLRRILLSSVAVAVVLRYSFCCVCLRFCVFARARVFVFRSPFCSFFYLLLYLHHQRQQQRSEKWASFLLSSSTKEERSFKSLYTSSRKVLEIDIISQIAACNGTIIPK